MAQCADVVQMSSHTGAQRMAFKLEIASLQRFKYTGPAQHADNCLGDAV